MAIKKEHAKLMVAMVRSTERDGSFFAQNEEEVIRDGVDDERRTFYLKITV